MAAAVAARSDLDRQDEEELMLILSGMGTVVRSDDSDATVTAGVSDDGVWCKTSMVRSDRGLHGFI